MATANNTPYVNNVDDVVSTLGNCYDALDSIQGIAKAILADAADPVSLAKGIDFIAGNFMESLDALREQLKNDGIRTDATQTRAKVSLARSGS